MITTSHLLLNLAALDRGHRNESAVLASSMAIVIGALLPDIAMFVFYAVEKLRGVPEAVIWQQSYYQPGWQAIFDLFNSLPIIIAIAAIGLWRKSRLALLLSASMALHVALDLPLHHDDGHRHFWPLSNWRFESPVSYWDPAHYGHWVQPLEMLLAIAAGLLLLRRYSRPAARVAIVLLLLSYVAFFGYALLVWAG